MFRLFVGISLADIVLVGQVDVLKHGKKKSDIGGPYYTKINNGLTAELAEKTLRQRDFGFTLGHSMHFF